MSRLDIRLLLKQKEKEEVSFSEQGAARQPLLLDSHRWQGIFQNDYTAFASGMTDDDGRRREKSQLHAYVIMEKSVQLDLSTLQKLARVK